MTETMKLALKVVCSLRLEHSWPLIKTVESALTTESSFVGCTTGEAANGDATCP